jgi:hypothetical protein
LTEVIRFGNDVHPSVAALRPLDALRRNPWLLSIGINGGFRRNTQPELESLKSELKDVRSRIFELEKQADNFVEATGQRETIGITVGESFRKDRTTESRPNQP